MADKIVTTSALNEVLKLIKNDIKSNSDSISTIQSDIEEIKNIIKDSGVTASSDWNDITNKPEFASTLALENDKLKLVGNNTTEMSAVDITTTDDINNILNKIQ